MHASPSLSLLLQKAIVRGFSPLPELSTFSSMFSHQTCRFSLTTSGQTKINLFLNIRCKVTSTARNAPCVCCCGVGRMHYGTAWTFATAASSTNNITHGAQLEAPSEDLICCGLDVRFSKYMKTLKLKDF